MVALRSAGNVRNWNARRMRAILRALRSRIAAAFGRETSVLELGIAR